MRQTPLTVVFVLVVLVPLDNLEGSGVRVHSRRIEYREVVVPVVGRLYTDCCCVKRSNEWRTTGG